MKKALKIGAALLVALVLLRVGLAFVWPTINDVRTGATPEYPDLQPQHLQRPPLQVFEAALEIAKASGWEITAQDSARGEIQAVATTRLWKFKDDVTITITSDGKMGCVVNLHSRSRVGVGDLGANARRIRKFQSDLTERTR